MDWEKTAMEWLALSILAVLRKFEVKRSWRIAFVQFGSERGISLAQFGQFLEDWEEAKEDASSE